MCATDEECADKAAREVRNPAASFVWTQLRALSAMQEAAAGAQAAVPYKLARGASAPNAAASDEGLCPPFPWEGWQPPGPCATSASPLSSAKAGPASVAPQEGSHVADGVPGRAAIASSSDTAAAAAAAANVASASRSDAAADTSPPATAAAAQSHPVHDAVSAGTPQQAANQKRPSSLMLTGSADSPRHFSSAEVAAAASSSQTGFTCRRLPAEQRSTHASPATGELQASQACACPVAELSNGAADHRMADEMPGEMQEMLRHADDQQSRTAILRQIDRQLGRLFEAAAPNTMFIVPTCQGDTGSVRLMQVWTPGRMPASLLTPLSAYRQPCPKRIPAWWTEFAVIA